jgi:hypothetical protein
MSPQVSQNSFLVPVNTNIRDGNFSLVQSILIMRLNHPVERTQIYSYSRSDVTLLTERSKLSYSNNSLKVGIGRDYIKSGPTYMNGPLFSSYTPSLDHISFNYVLPNGLEYEYFLIRLNDEQSDSGVYKRWLYFRRFGIAFGKLNLGLKDIVLSSGMQRGVELNYLNPGAFFQLEQLHGHVESGDGGENNDNQLIGIDLSYKFSEGKSFYLDFILDEFQIDITDRASVQDVFGLTVGAQIILVDKMIIIEYYLASPWLYTNGGLFTNVNYYGFSLGLRAPQSHGISLLAEKKTFIGTLNCTMHMYQVEAQTVRTEWNSRDNRIPIYDFEDRWSTELHLKLSFSQTKYLDYIGMTYNLNESAGLHLLIGCKLQFFKRD